MQPFRKSMLLRLHPGKLAGASGNKRRAAEKAYRESSLGLHCGIFGSQTAELCAAGGHHSHCLANMCILR